jgi:hypothetical protein
MWGTYSTRGASMKPTNTTPRGPAAQISPHELRLAVRINEACTALGISRSSLYELMGAGKIKTALLAGRRVIPVSELERVLSESLSEAA